MASSGSGGAPSARAAAHAPSAFSTLKRPGSASRTGHSPSGGAQREVEPAASRPHVERPHVGLLVDPERHRAGELAREPPPVLVVRAGDPHPGIGLEQLPLGEEVALHVRVEVEVVLAEVGEHAAAQWMPSARRSSSACEEISIAQATSPPSSISRNVRWRSIASGVVRWTGRASPPTIDVTVPSSPVCIPAASSIARGQPGRGRLAARAGDADHAQLGGRVAVEARGRVRHRRSHVLDLDLGHAEPERPADHERGRAARHRVRREVVAVAREAGDAEEQRAGLHHAVVVGEAGDLDVVRAVAEQLAQRHRCRSLWALLVVQPEREPPRRVLAHRPHLVGVRLGQLVERRQRDAVAVGTSTAAASAAKARSAALKASPHR